VRRGASRQESLSPRVPGTSPARSTHTRAVALANPAVFADGGMGPWKFHFSTKEDYYANVVPRTVPLVFNIRMDPFESFDNKDSHGHLMQKVSWLIQPMGELMSAHLKSLADYPPVQGGKSVDMSNVVQEFINKARQ
jgi:hypothetical protein